MRPSTLLSNLDANVLRSIIIDTDATYSYRRCWCFHCHIRKDMNLWIGILLLGMSAFSCLGLFSVLTCGSTGNNANYSGTNNVSIDNTARFVYRAHSNDSLSFESTQFKPNTAYKVVVFLCTVGLVVFTTYFITSHAPLCLSDRTFHVFQYIYLLHASHIQSLFIQAPPSDDALVNTII